MNKALREATINLMVEFLFTDVSAEEVLDCHDAGLQFQNTLINYIATVSQAHLTNNTNRLLDGGGDKDGRS